MKKNIILGVTVASIISVGLLSACGNEAAKENKEEKSENSAASVNTTEEAKTEEKTEVSEDVQEAFGLKDFEGFYCVTGTEEIEDYEMTYTYGYLFNGDGTGVSYVQDVVDMTWNETEIHFGDRTVSFTMEPGKLTVDGVVYNKIDGKFIAPNECNVNTDNIENGIYNAYIDASGMNEVDGKLNVTAEIYTEETYDIVDINTMAKGDVIYINERLLPVDSVSKTDFGIVLVNDGLENGGSSLVAVDESNCFVFAGMDMESSYKRQGIANLSVSDNLKLTDNYDPTTEKVYTGSDAVSAFKEIIKDQSLYCHNCKIMVEDGAIVEINRLYRP